MAYKTFAAIHVGSGEVGMKIYEISKKNGIKVIDYLRYYIELGSDTFQMGRISYELVNELCDVMADFKVRMTAYRVDGYVAYASSAVREASNCNLIMDQIKIKTGIEIKIISNSQQQFLMLKSIASTMNDFEKIIAEGACIVNMGAGSFQITCFDQGKLVFTQNLKLGSLRIREILANIEGQSSQFVTVMDDYIGNDINTLSRLFIHDHQCKNVVISGEEILSLKHALGGKDSKEYIKRAKFDAVYERILKRNADELSDELGIPYEVATVLKPACIVCEKILQASGGDKIYPADSDLCDGIAYEYAAAEIKSARVHNFDSDLIGYTRFVANKYLSNVNHTKNVEEMALTIFDALKKQAGFDRRDRMLLQIACILHDCGKFVNMERSTDFSSRIILATEFPGLSEDEVRIIANVIMFNTYKHVPAKEELIAPLSGSDYIKMLKLTAILRIANVMDRSHKQKIEKIRVTLEKGEVTMSANSIYDLTLEQSSVELKRQFFEEIYGLKPVLRKKRG